VLHVSASLTDGLSTRVASVATRAADDKLGATRPFNHRPRRARSSCDGHPRCRNRVNTTSRVTVGYFTHLTGCFT
jgi:hypothetical protein